MVEVVLVQCNLVDNHQHQQKFEVLCTFTPNKLDAYLVKLEPSNLVVLKTDNTEFDDITITFVDQICSLLETEDKVKGYWFFCLSQEIHPRNTWKIFGYYYKSRSRHAKNCFQKSSP